MTTTSLHLSTDSPELRDIIAGYVEAMLWAELDDDGKPLDQNYGPDDLAPETAEKVRVVCERFTEMVRPLVYSYVGGKQGGYSDAACAGHDLWFTSRGHGVGFWESDRWSIDGEDIEGEDNNPLCQACYAAHGQTRITGCGDSPYVGDDGLIYL